MNQDLTAVETGMTEVTASEAVDVPEAEVVPEEVTTTDGTVEMISEIVTDAVLMMTQGVGVVVAEATVVIEVDMVGTATMHAHHHLLLYLTPPAATSANRRTRQLLILSLRPDLLLHRYVSVTYRKRGQSLTWRRYTMIAWNKLEKCNSCWRP